jgi:hypothetical protein
MGSISASTKTFWTQFSIESTGAANSLKLCSCVWVLPSYLRELLSGEERMVVVRGALVLVPFLFFRSVFFCSVTTCVLTLKINI